MNVRRRDRHVSPLADRPDVPGRLRVQRRAVRCRRHQGRRVHDQLQAGHADRELPVPHELDDLPGDHSAEGLRRPLREDAADDRRLQPGGIHPRRQRPLRPQPELVGRIGPARRRRRDARRGHGDHQCADRRPARPAQRRRLLQQQGAVQQPEHPDLQGPWRDAPRDPDARRPEGQRAVRQARAPGDRAHAQPAGHHQDALQRQRRPGQRLAVRPGLPVHGGTARRCTAPQGPAEGQRADRRGRPQEGLEGAARDLPDGRAAAASRRSSSRPSSRSAAPSTSRSSRAPSTTRAPRRRRRGSTTP